MAQQACNELLRQLQSYILNKVRGGRFDRWRRKGEREMEDGGEERGGEMEESGRRNRRK
jgi:hypothetical protein